MTADGRHLHAVMAGAGDDLVVLEAGLGAGALSWQPVIQRLAPHTRVLAYDRAGYGSSEPDQRPRDLARLAADLRCVIDAVEHRRLVLAGHSWGGPVVRRAAADLLAADDTRADRPSARGGLAGLVLVDPSDEHAELYFSRAMQIQDAIQGPLLVALARIGLLRPLLRAQAAALPEPYRSLTAATVSTPTAARMMTAENAHVVRGLRSLRLDPLDLGDVPLTVISGRQAGRLEQTVREQLSAAHATTARAHPAGRYVEAHRSGHLVPFTEPDLVADEILAQLA